MLRRYLASSTIHHYLYALKEEAPVFGLDRQVLIKDGEQPQLIYRPDFIANNQKILPLYAQELQEVGQNKKLQLTIANHIVKHDKKLQDTKPYDEKSLFRRLWDHHSDDARAINQQLAIALNTYEFAHRTTKKTNHLLEHITYHQELIEGFSKIHQAANDLELRAWSHVYGAEQLALERGVLDTKIAEYLSAFDIGNTRK